jgi:hypothetical protein
MSANDIDFAEALSTTAESRATQSSGFAPSFWDAP